MYVCVYIDICICTYICSNEGALTQALEATKHELETTKQELKAAASAQEEAATQRALAEQQRAHADSASSELSKALDTAKQVTLVL
jgi:Na+-translocating ferredoxin:NAD+ oxidoreductase RnfC subunit